MKNSISKDLPSLNTPSPTDFLSVPSTSTPEKKLRYMIGLPSNPAAFKPSPRESLLAPPGEFNTPNGGSTRKSFRLTTGAPARNVRTSHSTAFGQTRHPHSPDEPDDSENYRKHLVAPLEPEKVVSADENPQKILGGDAVNNFYVHYKKLDKIKDINSFTQVRDATYTSMLGKTESLHLLPSKMGFIRENGESNKIKLNHFRMGDKYAEVLSEGLKSVKGLNRIELANNRLTPAGANHVLSKLNHQTEFLDLSNNNIGKLGCEHLCSIIGLKNSKLLEVNLEGNKLGDVAINQLCEAVAYNNSLRKLNIGKNLLSDKAAEKIGKMLEFNTTLEELYLQWNQIKSPGGTIIVAGLKSASKLRILDLSWNSLGLSGSDFAKSFGAYIATNTTLYHLDLSNNYINKQDAKTIAEDLKSNHTLYGFHFYGNTGYVDSKGFLIVPDNQDPALPARIVQPCINGGKFQLDSLKHYIGNWGEYRDVCWICEGWRPMEVAWRPYESGLADQDPIYVYISFEGYRQVYLPSKNNFKTIRMVPPKQFDYFYSTEGTYVAAEGQPMGKPENPSIKVRIGEEEKPAKLDIVNICKKDAPGVVLDDDLELHYELRELDVKPRIPDEIYVPPEVILQRPPWKFQVSIFRNYKPDTPALIEECFKSDFEGTRISKLVKDPEDLSQVKEILRDAYPYLKDCYKYYAAVGAPSDIWSIPMNAYTDFCNSCGIIDGKLLKLADFDRIFIATFTKSEKDRNPRNPDRALVRYQFLEGLVRISEQKYVGNGLATTSAEGLNMLMEENVKPYVTKFNHHAWRPESYWSENVDVVYKSYLPIMRGIFKKYSGMKTLPGQKKFMCLEEFNRLMADAQVFNDNFGERDATVAFSLAIMTQVDELNSDRIYQMQFVEFLEAFARITEKVSPPPYGYNPINPETGQPEGEMTYEQRFAQPLHIKLEGFMPTLFSLCPAEVKEIWIIPEVSIFQIEEVPPKQKFPTKKKKIFRINPTHASSIEPYDGVNALQV